MPTFPTQSSFIAQLAKNLGARKVLEIGKSRSSQEWSTLIYILTDFLKTNLAKFAAIGVKKDQKTQDKLENNHTSEAESKGEIQKKAKLGGRKEEKRKTRKC